MIFGKHYKLTLLLDSSKDAMLVSGMEGYGNVNVNEETEDLYRHNKVLITIPTPRRYLSAIIRSARYSRMGILNCIIKT